MMVVSRENYYKNLLGHIAHYLLLEQRLFDSNFSGAALAAVDITELREVQLGATLMMFAPNMAVCTSSKST